MGLRDLTKEALTRLGARCSPSHIHGLNSVLNYMETGRWLRAWGFGDPPRHPTREKLYAALGSKIERERVLYLEFGVYYGVSMRLWSKLLKNPRSSLHGFDSFEGLPDPQPVDGPAAAECPPWRVIKERRLRDGRIDGGCDVARLGILETVDRLANKGVRAVTHRR